MGKVDELQGYVRGGRAEIVMSIKARQLPHSPHLRWVQNGPVETN